MIYFYVLAFLGLTFMVTSLFIAAVGKPTWNALRVISALALVLGIVVLLTSIAGMAAFDEYARFDPKKCAQVVYIERKWTCVTWNEAA